MKLTPFQESKFREIKQTVQTVITMPRLKNTVAESHLILLNNSIQKAWFRISHGFELSLDEYQAILDLMRKWERIETNS